MATQTEESKAKYRYNRRRETSVSQRDIADLYSKIQSAVDQDHGQRGQPQKDRLGIKSRSRMNGDDCACNQIIVSDNSKHCALCDRMVPVLEAIQDERQALASQKAHLQSQLQKTSHVATQNDRKLKLLPIELERMMDEVELCSEQFSSRQLDMVLLNEKYRREQEQVVVLQQAKEQVESELQDLSQKLFAEAKGMVADEQRAKSVLEISYKQLESQLQDTQAELAIEEQRLSDLRREIEDMECLTKAYAALELEKEDQGCDGSHPEYRATRDLAGLFPDTAWSTIALPEVDPMGLAEFKDWIDKRESVPLKKLESVPFVKHCIIEDIEPCLRFGPDSRLSARKLSDAILANNCSLEETPYLYGLEQEKRRIQHQQPLRISAQKTLVKWSATAAAMRECQACGRKEEHEGLKVLAYRFRTSCLDDWACIDRHCRDRIMAVSEFYVFIRNIHQGYYNSRSTTDLYHEMMRLRLQMFFARVGMLPFALHSLGVKEDAIGVASAPRMKIQPPLAHDCAQELDMHC